jgi:phosphoribosylamine--glycine ligase
MNSDKSRVMVIGGGAREHALAGAIARAGHDVICAPGNAGTAVFARNAPVKADAIDALVDLAVRERIDLVVVGPELPLTLGIVDALSARGIRAFGPSRAAAPLGGSKAFMNRFLTRHGIATAADEVFDDPDRADAYIRAAARPLVVKTDGLAAGKGVTVATSTAEALEAVDRMMRKREFGDAGRVIVVEEFLPGEEASFHVVCDGERYVALVAAQDHKRVMDGDRGPNTGGMGAYAPAPVVDAAVHARVIAEIVEPTVTGMAKDGVPFRGVLFVGLMIENGTPRVLEYNVRFGDPETAVLVPLYGGDWLTLLDAAARGDLRGIDASVAPGAALCVVMAAEGYPAKPRSGDVIAGLDAAPPASAFVLHAGTATAADGSVVTAGGRVLTVGAHAATLDEAADAAYRAVGQIRWEGEHHRNDIGHRARRPW